MSSAMVRTLALALISVLIAASLMIFPKEALDGSIRGLKIWWDVVFPSLLPFFIISELLIGFGVITFLGALVEPVMRPFFRVPGIGGVVWAMGLASGNPAGAKITARLRQENKLTKIEAERLVSFTNSANPLFIFGAIAVGFFQNVQLGLLLAAAHYLGNISVGLFMRFYGGDDTKKQSSLKKKQDPGLKEAFLLMHRERIRDGRAIGKLLGDAVHSSIRTLLMIGGFIILFSVINKILSLVHLTSFLASVFSVFLAWMKLPTELSIPMISGLFEITLGAQLVSETNVSLLDQAIVTSFILAFSGFSIQAQVASILAETDISFKPFIFSRLIHGFFAAFYALILWKPLYLNRLEQDSISGGTIPAFVRNPSFHWFEDIWRFIVNFGSVFTLLMLIIFIIISMFRLLGATK